MKEIDKIRIRQWNQDNPYIQMKNLENAQPGYRVHTVNDDHHLYELPLETQNIILDWVFWNFYPAQKIYPHLTSDDLKEVLYKRTQIHLYNNQFKEAMLINGFWPRDPSELNWVFHIQASSPAIRTQADGATAVSINAPSILPVRSSVIRSVTFGRDTISASGAFSFARVSWIEPVCAPIE